METSNNKLNNSEDRYNSTGTENRGGSKRTIEDRSPQMEVICHKKHRGQSSKIYQGILMENLIKKHHIKQQPTNSRRSHQKNNNITWGTHPTP